MKLIQYNNNVVVDILDIRSDATTNNIAIVDSIPAFEPKEGYNGVLKYDNNNLYWDYEEIPVSDEISPAEFQTMIEEVL